MPGTVGRLGGGLRLASGGSGQLTPRTSGATWGSADSGAGVMDGIPGCVGLRFSFAIRLFTH